MENALILATVPRIDPAEGARPQIRAALRNPNLIQPLALTLLGFTATFTVVSFIGPVITATTGETGAGVGRLQVFIGLGSLAGLFLGGTMADRGLGRMATLAAFATMAGTLALYWPALAAPAHSVPLVAMAALILVGAAALFSLIPINLSELAKYAGPAAPIALALNGSLVSLGQGVGALWGGYLADAFGKPAMGAGGAAIAIAGALLLLFAAPWQR